MARADLLRLFKEDDWSQPAAIERLLAAAQDGDVGPPDVLKILDALMSRAIVADLAGQRNRCAAFARLVERKPDPSMFVPFVKAMKSTDGVTRLLLASLLPKVNDIHHHLELCMLLRTNDVTIRRTAASVLQKIGGRTTFDLLSSWLKEPQFQGRIEAADVLFPIAGHHAIPAISEGLPIGSSEEKIHILRYLSDPRFVSKDPAGAKNAIRTVLQDIDPQVQLQAVVSLTAVGNEEDWHNYVEPMLDSPNHGSIKAALEGAKRYRSPRIARALEHTYRIGPNPIRMAVLETAETIGDEQVLPLLVEALNHKNITIRNRAAAAITLLSQTGKVEIARTIIWLLRSRDQNVRRMAADIASKVKDPNGELWPKLFLYLRDQDWWVRERVIDALISMAGLELTRHIGGYLSDPSEVIRRYAVGVLVRLRDPSSLGALVRTALDDRDWWVRETAIIGLGELKDTRAVPYLVDLMQREADLRMACVEALDLLGSRDAAPYVAQLIEQAKDDVELRLLIVRCLSKLDDPEQADALRSLENDTDHRVRQACRETLTRWQVAESAWAGQNTIAASLTLLDQLLFATSRAEADDLILEGGRKPYIKRRGSITALTDYVFKPEEIQGLLQPHLTPAQTKQLAQLKDVDFSYEVKSQGLRFRANVFQQMTGLSAVFRVIRDEVPTLETLGLPPAVRKFAEVKNGLVLVAGPSGSGKSTTLAAMIDHINRGTARHIITLEDPIERMHQPKKSVITQREIGTHSRSYPLALRATLREDPDVILVGDLRDLPTISFAVSAAETGHLVLATMHSLNAENSVDRLINAFPPGQQPQVRTMLASSLRAVLCQHLLQRQDGKGRVLATEVMINNDAIANLIRKGKAFQIGSVIATSREIGMQSMDLELLRLYKEGVVSADEAYMKANNKKDFEGLIRPAETKTSVPPAAA
jgi:twitching motility protein PilT